MALPLSPRETTVLHYIAWGYTNKEIGNILNLSVKTIEAHKANGMHKLNVHTRAELVRLAVREGWLTSERVPTVSSSLSPETTPLKRPSEISTAH